MTVLLLGLGLTFGQLELTADATIECSAPGCSFGREGLHHQKRQPAESTRASG